MSNFFLHHTLFIVIDFCVINVSFWHKRTHVYTLYLMLFSLRWPIIKSATTVIWKLLRGVYVKSGNEWVWDKNFTSNYKTACDFLLLILKASYVKNSLKIKYWSLGKSINVSLHHLTIMQMNFSNEEKFEGISDKKYSQKLCKICEAVQWSELFARIY